MAQDALFPNGAAITSMSLSDSFPAENSVQLDRLVRRNLGLEWFEAIAIIQRLADPQNGKPRVLSFDSAHVIICADGDVHITATAAASAVADAAAAVQSSAALLRRLVPETYPMPLRLALTQALSTPPFYTSIREFSEALQYFERPDRTAIIKAVFQRWRALGDQPSQPEVLDAPEGKLQSHDAGLPAPQDSRRSRPRRVLVWGFGAAATAAALTTWMGFTAAEFEDPIAAIGKAGAAAVQTSTSFTDSLIDRVIPSPTTNSTPAIDTPAAAAIASSTLTPTTTVTPFPSRPSRLARPRLVEPPSRHFSSPTLFDAFGVLEAPILVPRADPRPSFVQPRSGIEIGDAMIDDHTIPRPVYSSVDADVTPAVAVYPHLPASAFMAQDDALTLDLVIGPSGNVESVKAGRAAATMGNTVRLMMSLSAAKAWRFQPAIKDGQTVRYRHTIWIPIH